jgi:hypothetical protein
MEIASIFMVYGVYCCNSNFIYLFKNQVASNYLTRYGFKWTI